MTGIRRKSAAFGFSLLLSLVFLMLAGVNASLFAAPALIAVAAVLLAMRRPSGIYALTAAAAFCAAALLLAAADGLTYEPSLRFTGKNVSLTGTVAEFPQDHPASQSVVLKHCEIDGKPTKYAVTVYFTDGSAPQPEDTVSVTASEVFCSAKRDSRFFYHTLSNGTWLSAFAVGGIRISEPESRSPLFRLKELRRYVTDKAKAYMSADLAAVSTAIVTGDRAEIPDEIQTSFRKSGISHLFAVSGMHLSLWTGLLFALLQKRSRVRLIPNLLALAFIWLYAAFTGFSPSVIRAGIMLSLLCVAGVIRKHADPLNSLGLAAAVMLTVNPWLAGNVSFLLSFTATFAIVGIFPLFGERKYSRKIIKNELLSKKEELLLGVTVLFATLPCSAYFFGYLPALAPVMSLLCTPIAVLMMVSSAVGAALPGGWLLTRWVYTVSAALTNAIVKLTEKAAALEFTILPLRETYIAVWFAVAVAVLLLLRFWKKSSPAALLNTLLAIGAAALATGLIFTAATAKDYTLMIPDAGNGTMISVVSGTGARSLVLGCGGDYEAFAETKDFLQSKTAFSPDFAVVPRAGKPETENLANLLKALPPDNLILPAGMDTVKGAPENTFRRDVFSEQLFDGLDLEYETAEDFCAGVMTVNGLKAVFCLYPSSDFTDRDGKYLFGDYLICRGAIPDTLNAANFGTVIVLTDKPAETLRLPPNAVSTADTGGYRLLFKHKK